MLLSASWSRAGRYILFFHLLHLRGVRSRQFLEEALVRRRGHGCPAQAGQSGAERGAKISRWEIFACL